MALSLILARVIVEERWVHARRSSGVAHHALPALTALPIADGGLGRRINSSTLTRRYADYRAQMVTRVVQERLDERELAILRAADTARVRHVRLGDGDLTKRGRAWRAYDRAEQRVDELEADPTPAGMTARVRANVELSVVLDTDRAVRTAYPESDWAELRRSLNLTPILEAFTTATRR